MHVCFRVVNNTRPVINITGIFYEFTSIFQGPGLQCAFNSVAIVLYTEFRFQNYHLDDF